MFPGHFVVVFDIEEGVSDARLVGVAEFQHTLSVFVHFANTVMDKKKSMKMNYSINHHILSVRLQF